MRYAIGIEREALRCTEDGTLCMTPHPKEFGDCMKNPFITIDFSESQIELRTLTCPNPAACYENLYDTTNFVLTVLRQKGEYLWPYSMPCRLPDKENLVYTVFAKYPEAEKYRRYL